ncbi:hypothetical protein [Hirschia litorea]|uniref:Uncharacterized protein n=1 Tax=Hirschia litorea TaxID=1199156 RepID=A0ABW2IPW8_9PROT
MIKLKIINAAILTVAACVFIISFASSEQPTTFKQSAQVTNILNKCSQRGVYYIDDIVCLNDSITEKTPHLIEPYLMRNRIVIINSSGGDATAAMQLAELFINFEVNVFFSERCWSSCFNYILPALKRAYLVKGTSLFGHGWLPYKMQNPAALFCKSLENDNRYQDCIDNINLAMKKQEKFFKKFDVSLKIRDDYMKHYLNHVKPELCRGPNRCDNRIYLNETNSYGYLPEHVWISAGETVENQDICAGVGVFVAKMAQTCLIVD